MQLCTNFGTINVLGVKLTVLRKLEVRFYRELNGNEPVRKWLKSIHKEKRRSIGQDIKTVQFGWPLGMPIVRGLGQKLWEIRSIFPNGIARVIFTLEDDIIILLHGYIKKSQKMPKEELELAKKRLKKLRS